MSRLLSATLPRSFDFGFANAARHVSQMFAQLSQPHDDAGQALVLNEQMRRDVRHWLV